MVWVLLTVGMFVKAVHLSVSCFKKSDPYTIIWALVAGLFVAVNLLGEYQPGDLLEPGMGIPIGFAVVIAAAFKDRLLPEVTEGTLYGYALVAGYIYFSDVAQRGTEASALGFLFMLAGGGIAVVLLVYPRHVGKRTQTLLMIFFLCISIYIGYELVKTTIPFDGSNWELILIGYSYLTLSANVIYVLYFIPMPEGRQTMRERLQDIRKHAQDLERKYVAVNSTAKEVVLTTIVFIAMLALNYLSYISDAFLISTMLTLALLVHTPVPPTEKNKFVHLRYSHL